MTLAEIHELTRIYSESRANLGALLTSLETDLAEIRNDYLAAIRSAVGLAAEAHDRLRDAVEGARELFRRPKTQTWHGVRVGWARERMTLEWDDDEQIIERIRAQHPQDVEMLMKTVSKPLKKGLEQLPVAALRSLGIRTRGGGDAVTIKPVDGEVERLVNTLLKDAIQPPE